MIINDGESRSELIFVIARQHVFISDNSTVRKKYFDYVCSMKMQGYCDVFKGTLLRQTSPSVSILGPVVQRIVSLTSLLRGQLFKCFITLLLNTLIFLLKK